jgi:predicted deacylase
MSLRLRQEMGYVFAVCFMAVIAFGPSTASGSQDAFAVGPLKAHPGQSASGYLEVPVREGIGTSIPVTVIRGAEEGPTLALIAGVHGYEYPPILALYRLKDIVDPQKLAGTLILVHIANLPSFQKRTVYYNPYDWKNLNRVFPGDPE